MRKTAGENGDTLWFGTLCDPAEVCAVAQGLGDFFRFVFDVFPTMAWLCKPAFGSQLLPAPLFQESMNVHPPGVMMDLGGGEGDSLAVIASMSSRSQEPSPDGCVPASLSMAGNLVAI